MDRKTKFALKFLYLLLCFILLLALILFLVQMFSNNEAVWRGYTQVYLCLLFVYTWYVFVLLFLNDFKRIKYPKYKNEMISVLVPCFNEKPDLLINALTSVINARGNKEVIIVDDGSTNNVKSAIKKSAKENKIKAHYFLNNQGKRHALHYAVTKLISKSQFVVTIDSDTILDKNALIRVVEPLKLDKIGASTGDVRLLNEYENWLTRMIGTYYWIGLQIYKKAQSSRGMVACCSGCLAAYKTNLITGIIDDFVNQEFLGEKCTHSEDRHLTNLILKKGYDVVYVENAISYTETPSTIKGFLKQQMRWKRGYVRESLYTLTHAWKNKKMLFLQILFWDLTAPFLSFGMRLAVVYSILTQPLFFLAFVLPGWLAFMFARYIFVFLYAKEKIIGLFIYMVFYEVFLYWMFIYALFTVKNKSWITRQTQVVIGS